MLVFTRWRHRSSFYVSRLLIQNLLNPIENLIGFLTVLFLNVLAFFGHFKFQFNASENSYFSNYLLKKQNSLEISKKQNLLCSLVYMRFLHLKRFIVLRTYIICHINEFKSCSYRIFPFQSKCNKLRIIARMCQLSRFKQFRAMIIKMLNILFSTP